jgi:diguanylate cyclase (GGDEF)-like protein/PAS domain S-box-containing protein
MLRAEVSGVNLYALLPLAGFVCNVALAILVLGRHPRAAPNRLYALLATAIAWWSLVKFARLLGDDAAAAALLFAVSAPGWCLLPSMYVHFVVAFTGGDGARRTRRLLWAAHVAGACFVAAAFVPGAMVATMVREPWGYTHVPGPIYRVFGAYLLGLFALGFVLLWRGRRRARTAAVRAQYGYLLAGISVPLVGGVVTNMALPIAGVHVVELGEVLSTVHAAVVAYAMERHGLLSVSLEEAADAILATMGDPLFVVNRHGEVALANPAATELLGLARDAIVGRPAHALVREGGAVAPARALDVEVREAEGELVPAQGEPIPIVMSSRPIRDGKGDVVGAVLVAKDIRALRRALCDLAAANEQLEHQAITDALTGLFNRREADRRLREALDIGRRYRRPFAVGVLDLDDFKGINDRHGHQAGDRVLQAVGKSLQASLRGSDVVARWGGDEFLVILHESDRQHARAVGERIVAGIAAAEVPALEVPIGASIGLAVFEPGTDEPPRSGPADPGALVAGADRALYVAKQAGKGRIALAEA